MTFKKFNSDCLGDYKEIIRQCSFLTIFGSEYCYSVICALSDYQKLQCALTADGLIIKGELSGQTFFGPPICKDAKSFKSAVNSIVDYCIKNNTEPQIKYMTQEMCGVLKDEERFYFEEKRDLAEYIYNAGDLAELKGKKYHSKRNFINTFNRLYDYKFKKYIPQYFDQIDKLILSWQQGKEEYSAYERDAILFTLKNFESCGNVYCDVLFAGGKIAGFIVGALNKHNDVNIIYEKGDTEYKGIYAMLLNYFVKEHFSSCRYINMQEDMGLKGLRKAKLSYKPAMLLKKYHMGVKND